MMQESEEQSIKGGLRLLIRWEKDKLVCGFVYARLCQEQLLYFLKALVH